jgi:hypothetical protein
VLEHCYASPDPELCCIELKKIPPFLGHVISSGESIASL